VSNTGIITGGIGGYADTPGVGGAGISLLRGGLVTNTGIIAGGDGGNAMTSKYYLPGTGGAGVQLTGGSISNGGNISGGAGGYTDRDLGGFGGSGVLLNTSTLNNSGHITGGSGGYDPDGVGGAGGAGVYINGGALTTSGTITGGAAGKGDGGDGSNGDAVEFGSSAGTLVITPTSVFVGDVVANMTVDDTLVLSGKGSGTLAGLGTIVTGFTTLDEDAHGRWTLAGTITGDGALNIGADATLTLNGSVSIATVAFDAGGNERLTLDVPGAFASPLSGFGSGDSIDLVDIQATSLKYTGHMLTLFGANGSTVDTLTFDGKYTQADFALQATRGGTEVIYAGAHDQPWGLSDFLPQGIMAPQDAHGAFGAVPTAGYLAVGLEHGLEDVVMVHFGHVGVAT
jgi:hypothetical protein